MIRLTRLRRAAGALLCLAAPPALGQAPAALAPYFAPASTGSASPDEEGFIRRWMLLEPMVKPNRTNQLFTSAYVRQAFVDDRPSGIDSTIPRDGTAITHRGATLRWHALDAAQWDAKLFYFAAAYGKPTYGVIFWATTVIEAPREIQDAHLAVGSNSASMWWLNGTETAALFGDRRMVMDDVVSPAVTLKKGRNVLTGAVINGPGLSDFAVRFVDGKGAPIRDIKISLR
ncbi:acetylxylan esterase [Novosphingobium cyanobacteriorum]|uniref:Acetylxylan esterase n=1 Tax=Novosphingobium cyanobacteriorum TaxID=3024215 RepID=A0ABT6CFS3_9SPHN|nr:acetylxylan esterase [Novosphingobium cyanobacteriorum]MDF8332773.1 acetylxylan esterase [Novosphingobium cyanobacteriorum]